MDKLVVFDLDFTLWDAGGTWCDCTNPPYKRVNNHVVDSYGSQIVLYPEVRSILEDLTSENIIMALASRTSAPSWARQLLDLFEIEDFFAYQEIYPSSKIAHFNQLKKDSGIPFNKMVFFDDEMRNIQEVGSLGVHAVYVRDGINTSIVKKAIASLK
ncbi:magnesium-dependent phosphatase-1 [Carboxylicivirga caseinilyticus]|uniref:magnesium-dependent phosphatase-1 n=1 Tax=Carboxylicivirga caseinilyticus TaxID=3417572 RepID=UPI003D324DAF|nr:magnesium-dependent phosphatase-1 [Marinilabiliaceae bacterium A049]